MMENGKLTDNKDTTVTSSTVSYKQNVEIYVKYMRFKWKEHVTSVLT